MPKSVFFLIVAVITFISSYFAFPMCESIRNRKKQDQDKIPVTKRAQLIYAARTTLLTVITLIVLEMVGIIKL